MAHFVNQTNILHKVYGCTFANSANNTAITSIFNVSNSNTAMVHKHH